MQNSVWFSRQIAVIRKGKRRVTRMVVVVVLAFAICWLPIQVSPLRTGNYYYSAWSDFIITNFVKGNKCEVKKKLTHNSTYKNIVVQCVTLLSATLLSEWYGAIAKHYSMSIWLLECARTSIYTYTHRFRILEYFGMIYYYLFFT